MDTIADPDITFDQDGVCNYYYEFKEKLNVRVFSGTQGELELNKVVAKIKRSGKHKKYDCIIGVSGGTDSTYTAWLVKKLGLRPLAVHLDNGWDSELSVKNIENILKKLEIDLYTEILDWEMFRDIQLSFLKASTPDGEVPTDHAILATLYKTANKFNVKYIISGMNFRSEGLLPPSWSRGHLDWKYIKSVQKQFGKKKINTFPHFSIFKFLYFNLIKRIKSISILNYLDFKRDDVVKIIEKELNWGNYEGKHHESVYTKFYQTYILPEKFGIDKRKAHLTCLILSTGEISREQALEELKKPAAELKYINEGKEYLFKKLGISSSDFDVIMSSPIKSIYDYPNNHCLELKFRKVLHKMRKIRFLPK